MAKTTSRSELPRPRRWRRHGVAAAPGLGLVVVVVLFVTVLSACGGGEGGSSPAATTGGASVLRVASWATITTWDPRASTGNEPMYTANIYEPLLYSNPAGSSEPFRPCLATSWETSKDGLAWTFHLRQGVKFHDGTPFNAAAVKYSIEATLKLDQGSAYMWYPVKEISTPDDNTVKITTSDPVPLDRIASAVFGSWMFSPSTAGKSQKWWNEPHEAGTGPYILVSYKPNEELVFKRNPDYWGGWKAGQADQVVVRQVAESATQRQMLEAGEVDFADNLSRDAIPAMEKNPNVKILKIAGFQSMMLSFNCQRKPLDNVKVRQALSYAVPYQDVVEVATNGYGKQSRGPLPEIVYPHDPNLSQYSYDLEKAKQLLAEAGYPNGGFKLLMTYASDDGYGSKFAPLIKEGFAKVGVTLDLQPLLYEQAWTKAKGPAAQRQDIWENLWWPGYPDGYDTLYLCFHTESKPLWNIAYWYDKKYDTLVDAAFLSEAVNPEKAQQLYNEAQAMLVDQAPTAYLFDPEMIYGALPSLKLDSMALNPYYTDVLYWYHTSK